MKIKSTDDRAFYWDWAKHEENLFTNRGNFFLVGQSMLFAGVATLRAVSHTASTVPVYCWLGVFLATVWILVNLLHHFNTRRPIRKELDRCEPRRAAISSKGINNSWVFKSYIWMGYVVPAGVLVTWITLLVLPNAAPSTSSPE